MLVNDAPPALHPDEAGRPAQPVFRLPPVAQRSGRPVEAVSEGEAVASLDGQIAQLIVDRPVVRIEERPPMLPEGLAAAMPQRRPKVERHDFRCEDSHRTLDVLAANGLHEGVDQCPHVGLVLRCVMLARQHLIHPQEVERNLPAIRVRSAERFHANPLVVNGMDRPVSFSTELTEHLRGEPVALAFERAHTLCCRLRRPGSPRLGILAGSRRWRRGKWHQVAILSR